MIVSHYCFQLKAFTVFYGTLDVQINIIKGILHAFSIALPKHCQMHRTFKLLLFYPNCYITTSDAVFFI